MHYLAPMALIPPFFMDCVVALGIDQVVNGKKNKQWIGTGFLFGQFVKANPDNPKEKQYKIFLVTNKHVIKHHAGVFIRFNPQNGQAATDFGAHLVDANKKQIWTGHPDPQVDVAVFQINIAAIQKAGMIQGYFKSDSDTMVTSEMQKEQVSEGDFLYVLGFPMGLMPTDRQHVIVRSGIIARIRDLFDGRNSSFTIDSFVFPGNSGGPVVCKPETVSIQGTIATKRAALIGIVKSYIPFRDVAISQQTKKPRIIFEENSGLANVETVDKIIETIQAHEQRAPKPV
jgi:S1-C subfamily serine protease